MIIYSFVILFAGILVGSAIANMILKRKLADKLKNIEERLAEAIEKEQASIQKNKELEQALADKSYLLNECQKERTQLEKNQSNP